MPQGKGKPSSTRRRPSDDHLYDDCLRLEPSYDISHSALSSSFDLSIPFNLPPRRSMKMLKDGSDYVWPEAAHSLFVRGLQAWKFMNIGSKRTRAPRGEGKTDFLVRYLESHGVDRSKKQVASHLQVLRTEWRNSDNVVLLSLVDDTVPHTRSSSEPSLPALSHSNPLPFLNPVPDYGDGRAVSTPSLPSRMSALPPSAISSSLYHPSHNIYNSASHSHRESVSNDTLRAESSINMDSWKPSDPAWTTATSAEQEIYPTIHHPVPNYDPSSTFHDYDRAPRPMPTFVLEPHSFSSDYYVVPEHGNAPSSNVEPPLAPATHRMTVLPLDAGQSSYNIYNTSQSYAIPQAAQQPHDAYSAASNTYGTEPYQTHYSGNTEPHAGAAIATDSASSYGDVVESTFLAAEQVQQQPQWERPPATVKYSHSHGPSTLHHGSSRSRH